MDKKTANIRTVFIIWACYFVCASCPAQSSVSPFDIAPRLPKLTAADTGLVNSNPFDIQRQVENNNNRPSGFTPQFQIERRGKPLSVKEKTAIYQQFLLITIIAMLVILTLAVMVFRIFIAKIWRAFLNDNMLSQLVREQSSGATIGYIVLYMVFFINAGIFSFLALRHFGIKISNSNFNTLFLCIGGIAAYYTTKHFLMLLVKSIFPIGKEVTQYNFTLLVFNIIIGIVLAPMILFSAYAPENMESGLIKLTIFLVLLAMVFRGLRGLFIAGRFFAWHKFHFLLYLCAVEIAPLVVTLKLLKVL